MAKLDLKSMLFERLDALEDVENKDDVKKVLESIKLDEVQRTIDNDYVNPIVKKTKEETAEKAKEEIRESAVNEFIESLNIESVDSTDAFKAYTKRLQASTEEKDEMISRYEQELNDLKPKFEETQKSLEKRNTLDKIIEKGFQHKYAEDVYTIASNRVGEDNDLDSVLDTMKDSYKMFVAKPEDGGSYDKGDATTLEPQPDDFDKWRQEAGLEPKK